MSDIVCPVKCPVCTTTCAMYIDEHGSKSYEPHRAADPEIMFSAQSLRLAAHAGFRAAIGESTQSARLRDEAERAYFAEID